MTRTILSLLCLPLLLTAACADYEYRYIEGEAFARGETQGLREEGFTSWMGHPSGGKVAVFGRPAGGFLEYDIKTLAPGDYYLYVRCLALGITRTHLLWDGQDLGLVTHDINNTSLRWSKPVKVTVTAEHVLRLQGSDNTQQWPYIDVILLTNQPGYVPAAKDADFVSVKTPWPMLKVRETTSLTVMPTGSCPSLEGNLRIERVVMDPPVLGTNTVWVTMISPTDRTVRLRAGFDHDPRSGDVESIRLAANTPATVTLKPVCRASGTQALNLGVFQGDTVPAIGYTVTIPAPVTIALDEYAYPSNQQQGKWSATFNCSPDLLPKMQFDVTLTNLMTGKVGWKRSVAGAETVSLPLDIARMPLGRYAVASALRWEGNLTLTDRREFIIFKPSPWQKWEPVQSTKAVGDTILMNGKPFLGRLVYHAGASEKFREQGFNMVQCWGADPDPLPQMTQHLDSAQKAGMYGVLALFNVEHLNKGDHFDLKALERIVLALKDHPALWCWDLIDEPDGGSMEPPAVQEAADLIRKLDPNHIVWANLCQNTRALDYLGSQDLWSFDFYPFPALTPFAFKTNWLNISDEKLLGQKPLGTVLQTFNYNHAEQRMPSPDELRTSFWLHVIHGYKWFGYYSYYDGAPSGCLSNTPTLWSYCRALNTEMVQMEPVVLAPGAWQPVALTPATPKLEAREKQVGGKWYVVVVSDSKEPLRVKLQPSLKQGKRRLLTEVASPAVAGTTIETTVLSFATQVWELTN